MSLFWVILIYLLFCLITVVEMSLSWVILIYLLLCLNTYRNVTLLGDSDISFVLFNHCHRNVTLLCDSNVFWGISSNTLNAESLVIYWIEQKIYPYHLDEWYIYIKVIYHSMSLTVLCHQDEWYCVTKMSDTPITVIYHSMSLTVLCHWDEWCICLRDLSLFIAILFTFPLMFKTNMFHIT